MEPGRIYTPDTRRPSWRCPARWPGGSSTGWLAWRRRATLTTAVNRFPSPRSASASRRSGYQFPRSPSTIGIRFPSSHGDHKGSKSYINLLVRISSCLCVYSFPFFVFLSIHIQNSSFRPFPLSLFGIHFCLSPWDRKGRHYLHFLIDVSVHPCNQTPNNWLVINFFYKIRPSKDLFRNIATVLNCGNTLDY